MKILFLLVSHGLVLAIGFAAGIYALPILTAPPAPTAEQVAKASADARYTGEFKRELDGSDGLHWGEGQLSINAEFIALMGEVSPGPDFRLYLVPEFVENEAQFLAVKDQARQVGEVKTFENFVVPMSDGIDFEAYNTVVIWCESFGEFISAASYR